MQWLTFERAIALLFTATLVDPQPSVADSLSTDILAAHDSSRDVSLTLRQIHHHGAVRYPRLHRFIEVPRNILFLVRDDLGELMQMHGSAHKVKLSTTDVPGRELHKTGHEGQQTPLRPQSYTTLSNLPDATDKETILSFAKMAANAYAREDNSSDWKWQDIGSGFNYTNDFGWENDGLRGHVFADERNETVVISIKGTSVPWLDDPDTTMRDLVNDNLFASCCCAQGGPLWWKTVCSCRSTWDICNSSCLDTALKTNSSYLWAAEELYYNITQTYPRADIWMTGHSLGGVVSSLLGSAFHLPTITFEAYPDALAASRLGFVTPPGYGYGNTSTKNSPHSHIYHFGHSADPIFMGTCGGALSSCSAWGYALQSQCHTGKRCVYDTVKDLGWREDIRSHSIVRVIEDVLEKYDSVPQCYSQNNCKDCTNWKFSDAP